MRARRTVADVLRSTAGVVTPARPRPGWMQYLESCALAQLPLGSRRTVLVLPSSEYAPAVLALAVVDHLATLRSRVGLDCPSGDDVQRFASVFTNNAYRDERISAVEEGRVRIAGLTVTTYADAVRVLPAGFPDERPSRVVPGDVQSAWDRRGGKGVNGPRLHSRVAAAPVVVIGSRAPLVEDFTDLAPLWPDAGRLADVGAGLRAWFRHPVICINPGDAPEPWLRSVTPALVVAVGAAGWRSPVRHALGVAPQILVLDRRSAAAVDVVADIVLTEPASVATVPTPPPGIEAWSFDESLIPSPRTPLFDADAEAHEDLF